MEKPAGEEDAARKSVDETRDGRRFAPWLEREHDRQEAAHEPHEPNAHDRDEFKDRNRVHTHVGTCWVGRRAFSSNPSHSRAGMRRPVVLLPWACVRRRLYTTRDARDRGKGLNLTPYVSPLLLRLHPDVVQRHTPLLAHDNEHALKHLNVFLELATLGCNNDAFNARKHVLALRETRSPRAQDQDDDAPLRFPLRFHVPVDDVEAADARFVHVQYTIEVPGSLVHRTLVSTLGPSVRGLRDDPRAALDAPFARAWQRTTKRILQDLFEVAHVPLRRTEKDVTKVTALAQWLAEEETIVDRAHTQSVRARAQNRATKHAHDQFHKRYYDMLTREAKVVHATTTGWEDGPTAQHAVLTSLLHSRLYLPRFRDADMRTSAFHWIANLLLVNFKELRLHSLVWNKVTLLVSADKTVTAPHVSWDPEAPEQGMGMLIPVGMHVDPLVDFIYENVHELEIALEERAPPRQAAVKRHQGQEKKKKRQGRRPRRGHFYQEELNALFRR
ncbi:hypothetical protein PsorP6_014599 [Peronosclerospora sorghi]|uniref:Uncharacterized protein n=1 Tax=Peronosclerospora sorghi TaxID=230839 RepID=A0ACC0VU07_9STRA|nr:hypothetical protein PsorP6_014599 [Peronosclerospora sorghi]